jgi:hypothetical protein
MRTSVFGSLLATTLLVGAVALSGCSAPVDDEASQSNQAIAQDEVEGKRLASDFPSAAPVTTGVDVWDLAFVTKGSAKYLVLSGYKVVTDAATGMARRSPAFDLVFDGEQTGMRAWTKEPEGFLSKARTQAIAADVAALQETLPAAASSSAPAGSVAPRAESNWDCYTTGQKAMVASFVVVLGGAAFILCVGATDGLIVKTCAGVGTGVGTLVYKMALWGRCDDRRVATPPTDDDN